MQSRERAPTAGQCPARGSLYQEVTNRIVADLERGRVPWVRPWGQNPARVGLPRNAASGRPYSGINILILWEAMLAAGWPTQRWLTFRQAQDLSGTVCKGARGTTVFYAAKFVPKQRGAEGRPENDGTDDPPKRPDQPRAVPFLKRFTVFNIAQCEGLPDELQANPVATSEGKRLANADALISATGADLRMGGQGAFYSPNGDYIVVPPLAAFGQSLDYYRTCLHELGHWTGHSARLARDLSGRFGSPAYAREELVAEMASAFVCAALGIEPTVRYADYLASWLDVLRTDNRAIFRAASAASKAADFLLARQSGAAALDGVAA
ncbi:MAG: DUF1738 domain-containing protein [Proteobacteria bacterium]|nr:DUF1738 domain-containing protein [Pseudomonadota bacterium]